MSNKSNDVYFEDYLNALKKFRDAVNAFVESTEQRNIAIEEIINNDSVIAKFLKNFGWYAKKGSPTLPKNRKIDMSNNDIYNNFK